jgi:molybdenum cofactor guanylyltransferase
LAVRAPLLYGRRGRGTGWLLGGEPMAGVGGVVLCGGQSQRMGRPKAWLPFAGEVMLPRVVRLLGEAVGPLVVVAAPDQDVPPLPPGVAVVRDAERGRGPLQGLVAGLEALRGQAEAAYLSSCDVPFLRPAFVRRLIDLLGANAVCVPRVGEHHHPLAAVYRPELADVDPDFRTLRNLNTPEEYQAALSEAERG